MGGPKERMAASNSSSTYAPMLSTPSYLSRIVTQPFKDIPLLPKAIFAPSIQSNLYLSRTRRPFTSAINTLLAIRYSIYFNVVLSLLLCGTLHSLHLPKPSQYSLIRSTRQLPFCISSHTQLSYAPYVMRSH